MFMQSLFTHVPSHLLGAKWQRDLLTRVDVLSVFCLSRFLQRVNGPEEEAAQGQSWREGEFKRGVSKRVKDNEPKYSKKREERSEQMERGWEETQSQCHLGC